MNKIIVRILFLLFLIVGNVSANTLSEMIKNSQYSVVGKVISVDSITFSFKVDSSINSKLSFDTIQVFKNGFSRFSKVTEYIAGQKFILFLTKPYNFDEIEGYFEVSSNNDGLFQIINKSVSYGDYTSTAVEFIKSIQMYYNQYNSFCTTFQNGEQTSKEIETFKKASEINQKLIEETYEYCYSDSTKMDNTIPIVSATKMNVLYIGPENPICIAVPKYTSSDLYVTITEGEILKDGECYKVKVHKTGRNQICVYDKKTSKNLGCSEFRVRRVPDPVVSIVGRQGGNIDKGLLNAANSIHAKLQDFDFDLSFPVKFYTVRIASKGDTLLFQGIGSRLTPEIKNAFSNLQSGAKVYVENVVIYREDLGYRTLGTIMFKIED